MLQEFFSYIDQLLADWFDQLGVSNRFNELITSLAEFVIALLLSYIIFLISRTVIVKVLKTIARRTESTWDDIVIEQRVFHRLAYLVPAYLLYLVIPSALAPYPELINIIFKVINIYAVVIVMMVFTSFFVAVQTIYQQYEISKSRPIKGYIQVAKIIIYILASISIIAILIGKSPLLLLGGLGAFSAVLLLIFKDSILGLVAGVQLTANDLLRTGDWITMPKYDADGTVIDITLTTVKVQNGDKTISTIPAYALFSESFKNWRGMEESGGRRIKRSVNIDINSIRFCTPDMLQRFKKFQYISEYINTKEEELKKLKSNSVDDEIPVNNDQRLTNVGIFRTYLTTYLKNRPDISKEMTYVVRHLQPTEMGLPIEIIAFCTKQAFSDFEGVQADIFDYILAVIPEFDLRIFQNPSGGDFILGSSGINISQDR